MDDASPNGFFGSNLLSSAQASINAFLGRGEQQPQFAVQINQNRYVPNSLTHLPIARLGFLLCRSAYQLKTLGPIEVDGVNVTVRKSLRENSDDTLSFEPRSRYQDQPFFIDVKKWFFQQNESFAFTIRKGAQRNRPTEITVTSGLEKLGFSTQRQEHMHATSMRRDECTYLLQVAHELLDRAIVKSLYLSNQEAAEEYGAGIHHERQCRTAPV